MTKFSLLAIFATTLLVVACYTPAQSFPNKPLRIIVPSIAGSAPDVRVRQIAPKLSEALGQHLIVDNRPGANGRIAAQQAAMAQPDGHTLMSALDQVEKRHEYSRCAVQIGQCRNARSARKSRSGAGSSGMRGSSRNETDAHPVS